MATRRTKFYVTVTPNRNGKQCFIEWGDGSRTICNMFGIYEHEYENKTADYTCNIVNAYEFSIGSGAEEDYSKSMVDSIPSLGDGLGRISDGLYSGMNVNGLRIPDSVESIGTSAFSGCTELEYLNLPKSISSFGEYAFDGCSRLSFTNPAVLSSSPMTSIPEGCFRNCLYLNVLSLPQSVTMIGASAFYDTNTQFYTFPRNLTDIGDYAFYLSNLRGTLPDDTLYFDSHVNSIGDYAFYYFTSLKKIKSLHGVDYMGDHAFADCRYLDNIEFSGDVGTIACSCFCHEKESVNSGPRTASFNDSIDTIGESAFRKSALNRIELPSGIREIGDAAFMNCTYLSVVQKDGVVAESLESIGASAFYDREHLSSFSVGELLTSIGDDAFYRCTKLSSFNFGGSLIDIGKNSFNGCTDLLAGNGKLVCPENLRYIGDGAFTDCGNISSVVFNDTLDEIPKALFSGASLVSAVIGNDTKRIGVSAFSNCKKLETVNFGSNLTTIENSAFSQCSNLKDVNIPDTVGSIGSSAFFNNFSLSSLHLPSSLTSVSDYVFSSCRSIKSLELPNKIESIGRYSFIGLRAIQSVVIPDSVVEIGDYAFSKNSSLTEVSFGNSIKRIGSYSFGFADRYNTSCPLSNIKLNEGLASIGTGAFANCKSSVSGSIYIPQSVVSIENDAFNGTRYDVAESNAQSEILPMNCFANSSIRICTLSDGLETIGKGCFSSCSVMSSINIPKTVRNIGDNSFYYCSSLKNIRFESSIAPSIGTNAFGNTSEYWEITRTGYGVRDDVDNIITIPQNSSGYYRHDTSSAPDWLTPLIPQEWRGSLLPEDWLRRLMWGGMYMLRTENMP